MEYNAAAATSVNEVRRRVVTRARVRLGAWTVVRPSRLGPLETAVSDALARRDSVASARSRWSASRGWPPGWLDCPDCRGWPSLRDFRDWLSLRDCRDRP